MVSKVGKWLLPSQSHSSNMVSLHSNTTVLITHSLEMLGSFCLNPSLGSQRYHRLRVTQSPLTNVILWRYVRTKKKKTSFFKTLFCVKWAQCDLNPRPLSWELSIISNMDLRSETSRRRAWWESRQRIKEWLHWNSLSLFSVWGPHNSDENRLELSFYAKIHMRKKTCSCSQALSVHVTDAPKHVSLMKKKVTM